MNLRTLAIILLSLLSITANAANNGKTRDGTMDFSFKLNYMDSMLLKGENGSSVDISDDVGFGFEVGYNYSEHLNFSYELMYNEPGYTATVISDETIQREFTTRNSLEIYDSQFNATYNFTTNEITPFISGGLGWSFMDSNVPTGQYNEYCVWDPWYGYVCGAVQDTYDDTNFSYNAKAGFRWDMKNGLFAIASYTRRWYNFDHASTLSSDSFQFLIGVKY